ncbi:Hyaluronan/mRNA-binding protein [Cinnamomum micranthum f. kanehirae]|uniref:Hyaluronan/mRNA-binding protein n=1 Tax=Cinnamomum micranthum f. kanehirae TaxID=337451 RepID=A0A443N1V7_9MAGN|nr:Hyaluronan/mRNA-binding protein [Cinnamomum micranthum f. kanehirae]
MATANPFDILGEDDNDDPLQLIAKQQQLLKKISDKKSAAPPTPAKLPSKPPPPSQAVKEAGKESAAVPRGGGRGGAPRGRGGRGDRTNRDLGSDGTVTRIQGGSGEDGRSSRSWDSGRGAHGGPQRPFRGGRRGGYGNGEAGGDSERSPSRQFERRSGTGRGYEMKREGAGRGNWGAPTDDEVHTQKPEEIANAEDKVLTSEKQPELEHKVASDVNKENPVNDAEEKEPEDKEMTLDEYQKILEEKRKALNATKTEERKVDMDKDLESMQQLSIKKGNDDIFIKLGTNRDLGKRKETAVKKSVSINEFLKPADGGRFHSPRGRGRGRGRSDQGSFRGFTSDSTSAPAAAPSIEDPGQFPTLGGK